MDDGIPFWGSKFRVRPMAMPELRKDPLVERWILVSTDRLGRPQELAEPESMESTDPCPFCAGNEHLTQGAVLTVPDESGRWRIRVVPNLFPAMRDVGAFQPKRQGLHLGGAGTGIHEVIVEAPQHERHFANLPPGHISDVFRAYAARISHVRSDARWRYPVVFKNSGAAAGASLEHVHSQLVLTPHVPPEIEAELRGSQNHFQQTGRCFFCDLIEQERAGPRFVMESSHYFVYMPFAGRFPFELCVLPRSHCSHFDRQPSETWNDLGATLSDVLNGLRTGLEEPPYNYVIHTMPLSEPESAHFHWHVEIIPRLNNIGGFEWGTGCNINTVPPEQAAAFLREMVRQRN